MPLSGYASKAALDWILGGAAVTRPAQHWVGLSLGTPNSTSASELGATSRYTRVTVAFNAATSPAGSAINGGAAVSFSSFVAGGTIRGWQIWDTQGVGAGNMLWCGLLSAATSFNGSSGFTMAMGSILLTAL